MTSQKSVVAIRLVTGEEVIAEISGQSSESISVDRPQVLQVGQDRKGNMGLALVPWFNSNPDAKDIPIYTKHIVAMIRPLAEIEKSYLQQVSGIALS